MSTFRREEGGGDRGHCSLRDFHISFWDKTCMTHYGKIMMVKGFLGATSARVDIFLVYFNKKKSSCILIKKTANVCQKTTLRRVVPTVTIRNHRAKSDPTLTTSDLGWNPLCQEKKKDTGGLLSSIHLWL